MLRGKRVNQHRLPTREQVRILETELTLKLSVQREEDSDVTAPTWQSLEVRKHCSRVQEHHDYVSDGVEVCF